MSETDPRHDRRLRLNAALDDELDAAHRIELERELERDPQLRASLRRLSVVREAVRRHGATEAAPAALRNAVAAIGRPKADWRRAPLPLAAAIALGIVVGAAAQSLFSASRAPDPVTASLVADFARAELSERPFDVASSDRHTVKPWLVAHAPLGVEIADLADKGYPLAVGRIAVVGATPLPTLVYQRREHWIALTEAPLSLGDGGLEPQAGTLHGFHMVRWADRERAYVAISDIDADELSAFASAFRAAAGVGGGETR
jgi:anti-sigma factor RsiW